MTLSRYIREQLPKPALALTLLLALILILPERALDPWDTFYPKKIAVLILLLTLIQAMGSAAKTFMGIRAGSLLTGFIGGLMSSTVVTASLARRSRHSSETDDQTSGALTFLATTTAMLFEAIMLYSVGAKPFQPAMLMLFLGPLFVTLVMIYLISRKPLVQHPRAKASEFKILPILKLALFIVLILSLSKLAQNYFGRTGLFALTFFVSLFELHGSVISNVQIFNAGTVDAATLAGLFTMSLLATFLSKLFLVISLGSARLKLRILKITGVLMASLVLSWLAFIAFS